FVYDSYAAHAFKQTLGSFKVICADAASSSQRSHSCAHHGRSVRHRTDHSNLCAQLLLDERQCGDSYRRNYQSSGLNRWSNLVQQLRHGLRFNADEHKVRLPDSSSIVSGDSNAAQCLRQRLAFVLMLDGGNDAVPADQTAIEECLKKNGAQL